MSKKIVVESGALADAIQKANRVAPTKGSAFDRFAGIFFEVRPFDKWPLTIKAQNGDITYQQRLQLLDHGGEDCDWRIGSALISGLVTTLPLENGNTITFIDRDDGSIRLSAGKVKARLNMIGRENFPEFPAIEESTEFAAASDFAQKADQVTWACHASDAPLSGVHLNGEWLIACDKYVMARIPCVVPVDRPITVPLKELSRLLSQGTDVQVRATAEKLYMMLDAETQATSTIYAEKYPDVGKALIRDDFMGDAEVPKEAISNAIARMLVLSKSERVPRLSVTFDDGGGGGDGAVVLDMEVPDVGRLQETIEAKVTSRIGESVSLSQKVQPVWFLNGINGARGDSCVISFGPKVLSTLRVSDSRGYESYVAAIRPDADK